MQNAEPIEMMLSRVVDPSNHEFDVYRSSIRKGYFEGEGMSGHVWRHSNVSCAKMAELIDMPFGLWARMGRRNHVLDGVQLC